MKYLIDERMVYEVKNTYREAEIFCAGHGIHPEVIVEITDEEAEEILSKIHNYVEKHDLEWARR